MDATNRKKLAEYAYNRSLACTEASNNRNLSQRQRAYLSRKAAQWKGVAIQTKEKAA